LGHAALHDSQLVKAEELVAALGVLARAQEFGGRADGSGANDDEISVLTASVREAEHNFRAVYRPAS